MALPRDWSNPDSPASSEVGSRLQGWRRLDWQERRQLAGLIALLVPIHLLLATVGYTRTKRLVERLSRAPTRRRASADELDAARRLARLASVAGRHGLVDATCLRQSLMVHFLLRRDGLLPVLHLGVRRLGQLLDAHAWVELDGAPLDQADVAHLTRLHPTPGNEPQ